jgi:acyl-CoA reductase-like NAD-dependent aldehyde dehydrogenase
MRLAEDTWPALVAGEAVNEGEFIEVRSPSDGRVVGRVLRPTGAHVERAIAAAVEAFEVTRKMPAFERQAILRRITQAVSERREEFAQMICAEAGKPIKTARGEVERAIFTLEIAAEESTRNYGEVIPLDVQEFTRGRWAMVRRYPLGSVAAITPFNFPLNLVAHKLGPAIAAGCTVVLKPASQTPISALMLAQEIMAAGWPMGALSVLPLTGAQATALVEDDRLKILSFTGSASVGWQLKSLAGKKRVSLELGGNAGCIVHGDADLEFAAERCAVGGFSYAGQSCISVQRIFVETAAIDRFLEVFVPKVVALKLGDPSLESTDVGPMIHESDAVRVEEWVKEAVQGGASVLCGGKRHGASFEPTVLTRTQPRQRVNCMELFAPVVTVEPYSDFDEALARVNDSPYGLQAGLFTRDAGRIFRAYDALEVGGLIAGDVPTFRIDNMPYGGAKDSGMRREGVRYAIEEMTERRLLVMNQPSM